MSRPELDEFWEDCIVFDRKANKKSYKNNNGVIKVNSCINFSQPNNNIFIDNIKKKKDNLLKKHKLLDTIVRTEISIPINIEKNKKKQIEILTSLYNKDLLDKVRVNKQLEILRKKKEFDELKDCSFKPKCALSKRNISYEEKYNKIFGEKDIYERDKIYKRKFERKMKQLKKEASEVDEEEKEVTTFRPEIKPKNLIRVLSQNSLWEQKTNNTSNRYFLWRYMKARKEESDKKKRLIWSVDKKNNEGYNNMNDNDLCYVKTIQKSISQKDSLIYKRELHVNLMSIQTNNDSDTDNLMTK